MRPVYNWLQANSTPFKSMNTLKTAATVVLAALTVACGTSRTARPDFSPQTEGDSTVTMKEMRWMAERKLVCVRNRSGFDLRVEIRSQSTGAQQAEIHVGPMRYAEEWIQRDNFGGGGASYAIIKAVGAPRNARPDGLRDMQTLPNGRNIELTIGTQKGGIEAFAHSYRAADCSGNEGGDSVRERYLYGTFPALEAPAATVDAAGVRN